MRVAPTTPETIERLAEHRTLSQLPRSELEWLVAHGELRFYEPGDYIVRKGQSVDQAGMGLQFVLSGRFGHTVDRGTGPRKVMEWQAGDVSGVLPFSRMTSAIGESIAEVDVETFNVDPVHFPAMIRECPSITAICVHVMLDRARVFNSSDWQDEKMMSLGRLAAGLAHELNNPASAVARSAKTLSDSMADADRAARALAIAGLTESQLTAVDRVRYACTTTTIVSRSPLERADREDEIASWLVSHGADTSAVAALAETGVTLNELDALAREIKGDDLDAALDWVAAGCAVRLIAAEIEKAASRIYDLVAAVKGFTHMDRAHVPEPVEIERGLRDTLMVLAHKARKKSVSVSVEIPSDLPRVHAIGGELNQVWMNLIDNALDAVSPAGRVTITATAEGRYAVVRVIDDGPGIPDEIKKRVFDPFFTTKEVGEGTGMGLETALRAVRGHGGNIEFDSRPGRTEFRVSLPLADDQPQKRGGPAAAARV
ncbi:MAG TPA: ATP-binding protein [Longimicrobiales bacterium]|nr:ATP-binding protein [Longimicrobiales bacterium]